MNKNAYNEFKIALGESDAQCECVEVFLRIAEQEYNNPDAFKLAANQYGVRVNNISTSEACQRVREGFLITVSRLFESYLSNVQCILNSIGNYNTVAKNDGETLLTCIFKRIFDLSKRNNENYTLYLLCDYYNLIRNSQAHVFDDTKKLSNAYSDLAVQLESAPTFVCEKLNAPSAPDNICFDDFILFSRATKELAQRFFKSIDYDEQKVANSIQLNRFSYLKNNKDRLCNKIKTELRDKYGISEESLDHIIDIVVKKIYND